MGDRSALRDPDNDNPMIKFGDQEAPYNRISDNEIEKMTFSQKQSFETIARQIEGDDYGKFIKEFEGKDDLNVDFYSVNELFDLLDIEPTTDKDKIRDYVLAMKNILDKNSNDTNINAVEIYKAFFDEVEDKLISSIDNNNTNLFANNSQVIQKPPKLNKIKRTLVDCNTIIQLDSQNNVPPIDTTACPDEQTIRRLRRYNKTNFEIFLEFKLKNNLKMALGNVVIPIAGYFPIDSAYNTNNFSITDLSSNKTSCIELPPLAPLIKNENFKNFRDTFNSFLFEAGIRDVTLNYITTGMYTGRFSVDSSKNHYEINWLSNDCDLFGCQEKNTNNPRPETRKNSTLGYLIGFATNGGRILQDKIRFKPDEPAVAARHPKLGGTNYFKLQFKDYSTSRISHNKAIIAKKTTTFKQPYYFKSIKNRIGLDNSLNFCGDLVSDTKRASRKGTNNDSNFNSIFDNLTQKQKFAIQAIEQANRAASGNISNPVNNVDDAGRTIVDTNNGNNPNPENNVDDDTNKQSDVRSVTYIIARDQLTNEPGQLRQPIRFSGSRENVCPIQYSGNTDVVKLGIALRDENDFLVDLHGDGIFVEFSSQQYFESPYDLNADGIDDSMQNT
jgi:hypothetical protein